MIERILVCPECGTILGDAGEDMLTGGRILRCPKCVDYYTDGYVRDRAAMDCPDDYDRCATDVGLDPRSADIQPSLSDHHAFMMDVLGA